MFKKNKSIEKKKPIKNNHYISNLYINDCYGVPNKIKLNSLEGWHLSKKYFIFTDSIESYNKLNEAFKDIFVNYNIKSSGHENSGVGLNFDLFSGELTKDDIQYIPKLKKIIEKPWYTKYKLKEQTIIVSLDVSILKEFTINKLFSTDIGFFCVREETSDKFIDYATELSSYPKEKLINLKTSEDFYKAIVNNEFLFKTEYQPIELQLKYKEGEK